MYDSSIDNMRLNGALKFQSVYMLLLPELPMLPHPQNIMLVSRHDTLTLLNYINCLQFICLHDWVPISWHANFTFKSTVQHAAQQFIHKRWLTSR